MSRDNVQRQCPEKSENISSRDYVQNKIQKNLSSNWIQVQVQVEVQVQFKLKFKFNSSSNSIQVEVQFKFKVQKLNSKIWSRDNFQHNLKSISSREHVQNKIQKNSSSSSSSSSSSIQVKVQVKVKVKVKVQVQFKFKFNSS